MEEKTNSISLSAYCTLRPKTNEKSTKNLNNTRFNSLKSNRINPVDNDDDSTIPYIPLENSSKLPDENNYFDVASTKFEALSSSSSNPIDEIIECDLIDLYDTTPDENEDVAAAAGTSSSRSKVEAINVALLKKLQRLPSINNHHDGTNSMCNTLTKKSHHNNDNNDEFQRLERYCTLRKIDPHKRKHILRNFATLRKSKKLLLTNEQIMHHEYCLFHELINVDNNIDDNCSRSSTPSISSVLSCCDPEKIEDCLLELDAYLEEIDRNCMCNNEINCSSENELNCDNSENINCINDHNLITVSSTNDEINNFNESSDFLNIFENYHDDKDFNENVDNNSSSVNDIENYTTNLKSNIFLNDDEDDDSLRGAEENIARGHQYRNTISVPRENKRLQSTNTRK